MEYTSDFPMENFQETYIHISASRSVGITWTWQSHWDYDGDSVVAELQSDFNPQHLTRKAEPKDYL